MTLNNMLDNMDATITILLSSPSSTPIPAIDAPLPLPTTNSSSNTSYDLCQDVKVKHMMKAHRIPLTIFVGISVTCIIVGSIFLLLRRNNLMFRRKAAFYLILASMGLLLYMRDSLQVVWTYPEYDCEDWPFYMYYLGAVPLHVIPVLARSWRTYCIYRPTPNYKCKMESILTSRERRHKWMLKRILIAYIPFLLVGSFYVLNEDIPYYVCIVLEGIYCSVNLGLTWKLFTMRHELRSTMLTEIVALFTYAIIACVETIYSNALYIVAYSDQKYRFLIIYYIYGDVFLCTTMWFLTAGKALVIIWAQRRFSRVVQTQASLNTVSVQIAKSQPVDDPT